jgi:outer membrane receptor protein involved in Fe transport
MVANVSHSRRFRSRSFLALLIGTSFGLPMAAHAQSAKQAAAAPDTGDIVVTATRRSEVLSRVPIKIDAYNQLQMDRRGIRSIEDIARYTPGLEFTQTGGVQGNVSTNISIRGISSDVGSATTAIYLDDTPMQIRNIGYFGGNPFPRVFDLERVEVLKGPQGTLFGASAEGGAVRFITPQPSLDRFAGYARAELSTTDNGQPSYEAGAAIGGPIVQDKIGFRISAWTRRDGGYIDRVDGDTGATVDKDANWGRTTALRGALTFKPTETLTITPSVFYQRQFENERSQYWTNLSDPGDAQYRSGNAIHEPSHDRFVIPALRVQYDGDHVRFYSNTSFFERKSSIMLDYTTFLRALIGGDPFVQPEGTIPSGAFVTTRQNNFTQEVRLQSADDAPFEWIIGGYYSRMRQRSINLTDSNSVGGTALNGYNYTDNVASTDKQIAGFANVGYHITEQLKVTAGVRVSHLTFSYLDNAGGPVNGGPSTSSGSSKETPVTPKVGVAYQIDRNNLLYANAAKGFRQGGAQAPVPASFCATDLTTLGLTASPTTYNSDSVWSFDAGSKNSLLDGKLNIDANAYVIKWKNIQQSVRLPNCGFSYISNLGKATSRGIDLSIDAAFTKALRVGVNIGFNRTTFDDDILGGSGVVLAGKGDRIGGPQVTGTAWGQFDFPLGAHSGFVRSDITFRTKGISPDPETFSYDADLTATKSTTLLSARLGALIGGIEVSAFVNNLLNSHDALFRTHDIAGSPLFYAGSYRPRTIGLTGAYRF